LEREVKARGKGQEKSRKKRWGILLKKSESRKEKSSL
jgi:hypothetical protein